jgi:hypothetical protein
MIPHAIVQYWDQETPSQEISQLLETWKIVNPNFSYELFNKEMARAFIFKEYGEEVLMLFDNAAIPAMRSDIFRVSYLLKNGGIYVDAATKALCPLNEMIEKNKAILVRKWHGGIWNGFIATEKSNSFIFKVWEQILLNLKLQPSNDVWAVTGPGVFNEKFQSQDDNEIKIIEQRLIKPYFNLINDLKHKKSAHWSNEQSQKSIFISLTKTEEMIHNYETSNIKEVYIHLGPHKTATTSVQHLLEKNEVYLAKNSFHLLTVRSGNSRDYLAWRNKYTGIIQGFLLGKISEKVCSDGLAKLFEELISNVPIDKTKLILSDENLLGPMPGHYFAGRNGRERNFYKASDLVFSVISKAFKNKSLKVLLCKRDYKDFVLSSYRDFIAKLTDAEDLLDYFKGFGIKGNEDYNAFYSSFSDVFGSESQVISFEDLTLNLSLQVSQFINQELTENINKIANTSLSWRAVEVALLVIPLLKSNEERVSFFRYLTKNINGNSEVINKTVNKIVV